jgi:UDP-N-acetyl-D-glucosamine dehydrogenase
VLLLGVSFKRNVGDIRNSSALKILELLEARGLEVSYHGPFVPRLRLGTRGAGVGGTRGGGGRDRRRRRDSHGPHAVDYEWVVTHARLVFDTRNTTRDVRVDRTRVVRL